MYGKVDAVYSASLLTKLSSIFKRIMSFVATMLQISSISLFFFLAVFYHKEKLYARKKEGHVMGLQKNFSDNINAIHKIQGKTLAKFAEESGISRAALQEILKGTCNPRLDTVQQIANQLKVDPLMLLSDFTDPSQRILFFLEFLVDTSCLSASDKQELSEHIQSVIDILLQYMLPKIK